MNFTKYFVIYDNQFSALLQIFFEPNLHFLRAPFDSLFLQGGLAYH
jgi:hypothetical protein